MRTTILLTVLLLSAASDVGGQVIPTDVPPVKLFEELNDELPELAKVKAAVDARDLAAAKAALLDHFRARKDAQSRPKPDPNYDTHLADNILKGIFIWGDTTCSYGPRIEDIQWYKVPKGVYWPLFDHELGRHTFVTTLVGAYRNTGDERYARHLIAMLLDFIKDCPVEDGRRMPRINNMDGRAARTIGVDGLTTKGHPAMMWSLMVAMRSLQRWPGVLQYCIHSEAMTPDALAAILTSMIEQECYIVDAMELCSQGNHCTRTPTTALELAAKFPEFKRRDEWADRAIMFVKPDYFVIIDRIDGDGKPHEYRMKYQLHHDLTAEADGVKVLGSKAGTPRVVVVPSRDDLKLSIVKGQKEPYYEGWHLYAPDKAAPAPALIYQWREKTPAQVETLIWPVAPGVSASIELTRQVADGVVTLTVRRGKCVDVISCGPGDNVTLSRSVDDRIVTKASSNGSARDAAQ